MKALAEKGVGAFSSVGARPFRGAMIRYYNDACYLVLRVKAWRVGGDSSS